MMNEKTRGCFPGQLFFSFRFKKCCPKRASAESRTVCLSRQQVASHKLPVQLTGKKAAKLFRLCSELGDALWLHSQSRIAALAFLMR